MPSEDDAGECGAWRAWQRELEPRVVQQNHTGPSKHAKTRGGLPYKIVDKLFLAQCPNGRKLPAEECTGERGAWHGMAGRAVAPGGSASTVSGPYAR